MPKDRKAAAPAWLLQARDAAAPSATAETALLLPPASRSRRRESPNARKGPLPLLCERQLLEASAS